MKVILTAEEAMQKGIWPELARLFGRDSHDDIWPQEEFILTEDQAKRLGLLPG